MPEDLFQVWVVIDLDIKGFFDKWMQKYHSGDQFGRYADDVIVHLPQLKKRQNSYWSI